MAIIDNHGLIVGPTGLISCECGWLSTGKTSSRASIEFDAHIGDALPTPARVEHVPFETMPDERPAELDDVKSPVDPELRSLPEVVIVVEANNVSDRVARVLVDGFELRSVTGVSVDDSANNVTIVTVKMIAGRVLRPLVDPSEHAH